MNEHSTQLIDHAGATGNRKLMSPHYLTTMTFGKQCGVLVDGGGTK